jgi:replicative DNA helicase
MANPLASLEAEQALLGGLFLAPEQVAAVAALVSADDFTNALHRKTFAAMAAMDGARQKIDLVTVAERLEAQGTLGDSDWALMAVMARDTPSAANVAAYARIVRDYAKRRTLVSLLSDAQRWAMEDGDAEKTHTRLRDALDALDSGKQISGPVLLRDVLADTVNVIDQRCLGTAAKGMATGLTDLDRIILGLQPGNLYVVAGRPAMGKSVLGLQLAAETVLTHKKPALFVTAEMPNQQQVERLIASLGRIDLSAIQTGQLEDGDWNRITSAVSMLSQAQMWLDETPSPQIADIVSKARRLHRLHGPLGLVVIDHAGLVSGRGESRNLEQAEVAMKCKALAKELACPVVALTQLNRKLEDRNDKRPIMADLRDSGEWEQSADVVLMIYRDEVYNPDSADKGCAELLIRKHRGGKLGLVATLFAGQFSRFESLSGGLPSASAPPAPQRKRGIDF